MRHRRTIRRLERAKAEMLRRGWTRATMQNAEGQLCLLGALDKVSIGYAPFHGPTFFLGLRALANATRARGHHRDTALRAYEVIHFNDIHAVNAEDALRLFDEAIAQFAETNPDPVPVPEDPPMPEDPGTERPLPDPIEEPEPQLVGVSS